MDFVFDLTIPPNTLKGSPARKLADLGEGIISQVEISFPPGCANKVHAIVRQGLHQVWPSNEDGTYHWDDHTYSRRQHYPVKSGDPLFILEGWSPTTIFPHSIQFSFSVLPKKVLEPAASDSGLRGKLRRLTQGSKGGKG